jgi:hypothetical protein
MISVNLPLQFAAVEAEIRSRRLNICNDANDRASRARRYQALSPSRFGFLSAHDLFGVPLRTFPDHALTP